MTIDSEAALRNSWRRQAESLRDQFENIANQYLRENDGWPTIEFAMVQLFHGHIADYSTNPPTLDNDPIDSTLAELHKETFELAVSRLHKNGSEIPCSRLWAAHSCHSTGWARSFATNLPSREWRNTQPSELRKSLSKVFRIVDRLFLDGENLLRTIPFEWPECGPPSFRLIERNISFAPTPKDWLSILFEASWGPAHRLGLETVRGSVSVWHKASGVKRRGSCLYIEGQSPKCFYSISLDVLKDSARLIDWLLSLCDTEAKRTPDAVEPLTGDNEAGGGKGNAGGGQAKLRPCDIKAGSQYKLAIEDNPQLKTDRAAYDWYVEQLADENEKIPNFESWWKFLRNSRANSGSQKNKRGVGHETRSVVSGAKIEQQNRTEADRS